MSFVYFGESYVSERVVGGVILAAFAVIAVVFTLVAITMAGNIPCNTPCITGGGGGGGEPPDCGCVCSNTCTGFYIADFFQLPHLTRIF